MNHQRKSSFVYIFLRHFFRNLILGFFVLLLILFIGIVGYHYIEKVSWLDSYVNAAMIVSGVGTLNNPNTFAGKIFVATYSIVGGASFLLIMAVVFSPVFHWVFRQLNIEDREHFSEKK